MGSAHEGHGHADVDIHVEREVAILLGPGAIHGDLVVPRHAGGIVAIAHTVGAGRRDAATLALARSFQERGLATLMVELLTDEERDASGAAHLDSDVELLASRMVAVDEWLATHDETSRYPVGWVASDAAAAAALVSAAGRPRDVYAVVSIGGRPDLATEHLDRVRAPTLLLAGDADRDVVELNRRALDALPGEKALEVVKGRGRLLEEGSLERVTELAGDWLRRHLVGPERATPRGPLRSRSRATREV